MEHIKLFFDTSTIHGLSWISRTKRWSRLFWTLIVFGGFTVAGYFINESFYNWKQSPISTTIETLPITQITFPNVTICLPNRSFLNLNYDLNKAESAKFKKKTMDKLFDNVLNIIQDEFYKESIVNLSKVEDPDKFYNWYHGYTQMQYPYYSKYHNQLFYYVTTSATSANISTQYFGTKFDPYKVDGYIHIMVNFHVHSSAIDNRNITLMLNVQKNTMQEVSENDRMIFTYYLSMDFNPITVDIEAELKHWSRNVSMLSNYAIKLDRKVSLDEIRNVELDVMPGFVLSWNYDKWIKPVAKYGGTGKIKAFVRYIHFNSFKLLHYLIDLLTLIER